MEGKNKTKRKKPRLFFGLAKGSVTVEMSYFLPVLLLAFFLTVYTVFYFHDKVIINGAAAETAAAGAQAARRRYGGGDDFEKFYEERVAGKLILLRLTAVSADVTEDEAIVSAEASSGKMSASAHCRAAVVHPEKKIRSKRKLKSLSGKERD